MDGRGGDQGCEAFAESGHRVQGSGCGRGTASRECWQRRPLPC
jgi:hypothetical protein